MVYLQVILGAVTSLAGVIVTEIIAYHKEKSHEIAENHRLEAEMSQKNNLSKAEFEHQLILSNRQFIPQACKDILESINLLYDFTEKLVVNYPGTANMGKMPGLLFKKSINNLDVGFPDSLESLISLDRNFQKTYRQFENMAAKNGIFMPNEIRDELEDFKENSNSIKSYFYGRFGNIDAQTFAREKQEYNTEKLNLNTFITPNAKSNLANEVISLFAKLAEDKNAIADDMNEYIKRETHIGI